MAALNFLQNLSLKLALLLSFKEKQMLAKACYCAFKLSYKFYISFVKEVSIVCHKILSSNPTLVKLHAKLTYDLNSRLELLLSVISLNFYHIFSSLISSAAKGMHSTRISCNSILLSFSVTYLTISFFN